jgi:hypothetical protein
MATTTHMARTLVLLLAGLLLTGAAGCQQQDSTPSEKQETSGRKEVGPESPSTRGKFGAASCTSAERVDVDATAVIALYYDEAGNVLGSGAEDLWDTSDKKMCLTTKPPGPGGCGAGRCSIIISGTEYCRKC